MAKKSIPTEPVNGVLLVDDPNINDDEIGTVVSGQHDPAGTPVVPVVESPFDSRITAGEYRANGIEIDPKIADDEVPGYVVADRHVAPGTPVEPVREHVVVSDINGNESGLSAAERIAALNEVETAHSPEPQLEIPVAETPITEEQPVTEESETN